jgi:hypothetical protein
MNVNQLISVKEESFLSRYFFASFLYWALLFISIFVAIAVNMVIGCLFAAYYIYIALPKSIQRTRYYILGVSIEESGRKYLKYLKYNTIRTEILPISKNSAVLENKPVHSMKIIDRFRVKITINRSTSVYQYYKIGEWDEEKMNMLVRVINEK